jgi:DUF917 family protein
MKKLSKQDMLDYVSGAVILGCGGGGGATWGISMIEEAFEKSLDFWLADINDIEETEMLCILAGVGGGVPQEVRDKVAHYHEKVNLGPDARLIRLRKSAEELSNYIGKDFYGYIASETGGGNGVLPMFLNAIEGKPSVDADCCGRAKPEMGISLTHAAEIPVTPLSMVSPFLETVLLKNAVDDYRAEDIARNVAVASGGSVTVARCPATVKEYKKGIIPGQVSRCIAIGKSIREAKEKELDIQEEFKKASEAIQVFKGLVTSFTMEGKGGFNWGNWVIKGSGKYSGHEMKVWYKNENLVSWLDGEPYILCPDLITIIDDENFEGTSNFVSDKNHEGKNVIVYCVQAHKNWKKPKALELFSPKHFGFNIDYVEFSKARL